MNAVFVVDWSTGIRILVVKLVGWGADAPGGEFDVLRRLGAVEGAALHLRFFRERPLIHVNHRQVSGTQACLHAVHLRIPTCPATWTLVVYHATNLHVLELSSVLTG